MVARHVVATVTMRAIETKALKPCLGVKQGTSNDIIYQELNQPDITAAIKVWQFNFFKEYLELQEHECTFRAIWKLYDAVRNNNAVGNIRKYCENLKCNCSKANITEGRNRIINSQNVENIYSDNKFGIFSVII